MQYPIINNFISAYFNNGWTGLDIPDTITYEPIQLGNGAPSPDNVRPILSAKTLNIGGVDVPVYGGSLDVSTGVLTVNKVYKNIKFTQFAFNLSIQCLLGYSSLNLLNDAKQPANNSTPINAICDMAKIESASSINGGTNGFGLTTTKDIYFRDNLLNSQNEYLDKYPDGINVCYEPASTIIYQLTNEELITAIGIKDDIAHRLKLPMLKYFSHVVIEALQKAADGTQTADDEEILRHYLTPLGIGGI